METHDAAYWVRTLQLAPHPEGGYFREVYRSEGSIPASALPARFSGDRKYCTSIFYLLEAGDFSAFHRICSDEIWHFYAGGPLELHVLSPKGHSEIVLGRDPSVGHHLQYVVPAQAWFAARPARGTPYALLGCTVSPGFDFADFEMAKRTELVAEFPQESAIITALTRQ
jgi:predicted cupin superfamily sugar epimerase